MTVRGQAGTTKNIKMIDDIKYKIIKHQIADNNLSFIGGVPP